MRRLLGALLVSSVALAACDDGGADEVAPTTTDPPTTTSSVARTTTTSTTEPVPFDIEVRRAAIDLLEIRNDVFMHPDVARVSDYVADTCTCLERERGFIERFVAEGLRWEGPPLAPVGISLDNDDAQSPILSVVSAQPGTTVIDSTGQVVENIPRDDTAAFQVSLTRTLDGEWRVNLLEGAEFTNATIETILEVGLP